MRNYSLETILIYIVFLAVVIIILYIQSSVYFYFYMGCVLASINNFEINWLYLI